MAKRRRPSPRSATPIVLVVDDGIEHAKNTATLIDSAGINAIARVPDEVTLEDLQSAAVVLVDYVLSEWRPQQPDLRIAQIPRNGLALIGVLRSHCEPGWAPTAFCLYSAQIPEITGALPGGSRLHLSARANNLEWVFSKLQSENAKPLSDQISMLAKAVASLPDRWPVEEGDGIRERVGVLLALKVKSSWANRAWETIQSCRPPVNHLAQATHGLSFLRWLLHSILPYPTFLWDDRYLAARLRVTPDSLRSELDGGGKLLKMLKPALYTGVLSSFFGRRWWRVAIEDILWEETSAKSFEKDSLATFIRRTSKALEPVNIAQPVVALDETLNPLDDLFSIDDVQQIQPDGWPPYADPAWASTARLADEAGMRALVVRRAITEG